MVVRKRIKKESLKEFRRHQRNEKVFLSLLGLFLLLLFFAIFLFSRLVPDELTQGTSAYDFCIKECFPRDCYSSNNNSAFNFIRCECVGGIKSGDGKYSPTVRVQKVIHYYDSESFEEISKGEVLSRIEDV